MEHALLITGLDHVVNRLGPAYDCLIKGHDICTLLHSTVFSRNLNKSSRSEQ